ncbi:MAG TPA: rhomboid family intramembrane serine protease [Vicinamibacterales bacterium]|jgi:rhomboid protease GluP|nr:rhomboid family intramembrane serine protease [Vicinamibacterales bacterium]
MFSRQKTGSVVCTSCGSLVGVNDDRCYNCGRRNPGLWGFGPMLRRFGNDLGFVTLVVYGCSILYVAMLLVSVGLGGDIMGGGNPLGMLSPVPEVALAFGSSGAIPVFRFDMWWTVLSAGWLHGSALHILFNMLWVRQLGPAVADVYGAGRMVIIYTIASVVGFTLSSTAGYFLWWMPIPFLRGAMQTLGASAPIFGLLGALVYYGRRGGSSIIGATALQYALVLGIFGFIMTGVDNYAHAGGFLGGYLAGMWLDPLRPERMDHLLWAVACLAVTGAAILASLVTVFGRLVF